MQVKDIMTKTPACCTPDTGLGEVARTMLEHDCGCVPVVEGEKSRKLVGVVTDRDIVCRTVAEGKNPLNATAGECMSQTTVTVTPETSVEECCKTMEQNQVRRVPVVDQSGSCCGIVSQADIAHHAPKEETAKVVREVSRPTETASRAS